MTPLQMKKGRAGVQVSVVARADDETRLAGLLLAETTTLGVRVQAAAVAAAAARLDPAPAGVAAATAATAGSAASGAAPELPGQPGPTFSTTPTRLPLADRRTPAHAPASAPEHTAA